MHRMLPANLHPVLAAISISDVIQIVIFAVIIIGPALAGLYRKMMKQRAAEEAWRDRVDGGETRDQLAAVAAERKRQLQRQAAARQQRAQQAEAASQAFVQAQTQTQTRTQAAAQPQQSRGPLTMAERIALARQQATIQRSGRTVSQPSPQSAPFAQQLSSQQQAAIDARRRAAQQQAARLRQQQQAQAQAQAAARAAAVQRQREQEQLKKQQAAERQRAAQQARMAKVRKPAPAAADTGVADAPVESDAIRSKLLNRKSLREANVLREILDRPVSMR